jgi:ribosome biogenesis protein ENP2
MLQVYTVSGGKSVPAWLSDKKKRSLKKDEAYRRRIELVQDLDFPEACQRLRASPDGQYLFATGIHPPRVPPCSIQQGVKFVGWLSAYELHSKPEMTV